MLPAVRAPGPTLDHLNLLLHPLHGYSPVVVFLDAPEELIGSIRFLQPVEVVPLEAAQPVDLALVLLLPLGLRSTLFVGNLLLDLRSLAQPVLPEGLKLLLPGLLSNLLLLPQPGTFKSPGLPVMSFQAALKPPLHLGKKTLRGDPGPFFFLATGLG